MVGMGNITHPYPGCIYNRFEKRCLFEVVVKNATNGEIEVDGAVCGAALVEARKLFVELMAIVLILQVLDLLVHQKDSVVVNTLYIQKPRVVVVVEVDFLHGADGIVEVDHLHTHQFVVPMGVLIGQNLLVVKAVAIVLGIGADFYFLRPGKNLFCELSAHNEVKAFYRLGARAVGVLLKELLSGFLKDIGVGELRLQFLILFNCHGTHIVLKCCANILLSFFSFYEKCNLFFTNCLL